MTARSGDPSIISEADQRQAGDEYVFAKIEEFRKTMHAFGWKKSSRRATKGINTDAPCHR
jgi:hypothetical protein